MQKAAKKQVQKPPAAPTPASANKPAVSNKKITIKTNATKPITTAITPPHKKKLDGPSMTTTPIPTTTIASTNTNIAVSVSKKAKKESQAPKRLHTIENFINTPYTAPTKDSVQGVTIKANLKTKFNNSSESIHVIFVTQDELIDKKKDSQHSDDEESSEKPAASAIFKLSSVYKDINWNDATKHLLKAQNFTGKASSIAALANKQGNPVFLVGLGKTDKDTNAITANTLRKAVGSAVRHARRLKLPHLQIAHPTVPILKRDLTPTGYGNGVDNKHTYNTIKILMDDEVISNILRTLIVNNYHFDKYLKQSTINEKHFYLNEVTVVTPNNNIKNVHTVVHQAESQNMVRELSSLKLDDANSTYIKEQCEALVKMHPDVFSITVLDKNALQEQKLNLILAVNKGSTYPPYIVGMEYTPPAQPAKKGEQKTEVQKRPYAFVGKTLTFDTGGYCLKPGASMLGMEHDKNGGSCVLGLMRTLALTRPATSRKIVGVMPITDNMIGPDAITTGSVIETPKGSVAINNTDAEGRLILASALEFAQKNYKPARITTMATLTGAILMSLGHNTGVFTNKKEIAEQISQVGDYHGEIFWNMPILKENHASMEGSEAEILNISKGKSHMGSSTAAAFLEKFIDKKVEFCHLDIAGSATTDANSATGATMPTLQEIMSKY